MTWESIIGVLRPTAEQWSAAWQHLRDHTHTITITGQQFTEYHYIPAELWTVDIPKSMETGATGAETIVETLSNGIVREYRGYGYTSAQYSFASIPLPDDYISGTLYARVWWETESADLNTLVMHICGTFLDDNDLTDIALTSPSAIITDTNNGAKRLNKSGWILMNPSGSGKDLQMALTRDYGTDTLEDDVKILKVQFKYMRLLP